MDVLTHAVTHVLRANILGLLVRFAVLVTLLVLADLVFQEIGSARDARRFPPPGHRAELAPVRSSGAATTRAASARSAIIETAKLEFLAGTCSRLR